MSNQNRIISFGLNPVNANIIRKTWPSNVLSRAQKTAELKKLDIADPDTKKLAKFINSLLVNPKTSTDDLNILITKSQQLPDALYMCNRGLKSLKKRWGTLMMSVRENLATFLDANGVSHPQIGYLSRSAMGKQGKQVLRNMSVTDYYITQHIKPKNCPDKQLLLKLHSLLTEGIGTNVSGKALSSSQYGAVVRGTLNDKTGIVDNDSKVVEQRLDKSLTWLKNNYAQKNTFELSAKVYKDFLSILPFHDGNGRTARAFLRAILYSKGIDIKFPSNFAEIGRKPVSEIATIIKNNCYEIPK